MLPIANPAFHLHILQLVLLIVLSPGAPALGGFILAVLFPGYARAEDDVFADGGGVEGGARGVALFEAEFGPGAAGGDAGVYGFVFYCCADAAGCLR